jgi:hypothetical protein
MIRGKGSDFTQKTDDNFDEQMKFKEDLKKRAFQKPVRVEPTSKEDDFAPRGKKSVVLKSRTEKLQPVKTEKPEIAVVAEKIAEAPTPVATTPKLNGSASFNMAYALNKMDMSLDAAREALLEKAPDLVIAHALTNFYPVSIQMVDAYCKAKVIDPRATLQKKRNAIQNLKEVTHQDVVDKFDEAQRVHDTKKDIEKSFDLVVEAVALCEHDLMPHQMNIPFTQEYAPNS